LGKDQAGDRTKVSHEKVSLKEGKATTTQELGGHNRVAGVWVSVKKKQKEHYKKKSGTSKKKGTQKMGGRMPKKW